MSQTATDPGTAGSATPEQALAVYTEAMRLAAAHGWIRLTLGDIATATGLNLAEIHAIVPGKAEILTGIADHADRQVLLAAADLTAADPAHDRLFDVIMQRFDALRPFRDGIRAVLRDLAMDPPAAAALLGSLGRSMGWLLEAARMPATGPLAPIRITLLGGLYASLIRTWLADDTDEFARTMALLDQRLKRIGPFLDLR